MEGSIRIVTVICIIHEYFTKQEYDIKHGKKFKKNVVMYLTEEKLLCEKSNYLCMECSKAVENILSNKNMSKIESKRISNEYPKH